MTFFRVDNVRIDLLPGGVACLWLDVPGKGQNVLSRAMLADLEKALDHLKQNAEPRVLVVRSAKGSGFLAGADLSEFAQITTAAEAEVIAARGQELFAKLAALPIP